jgi:cytochrome c5
VTRRGATRLGAAALLGLAACGGTRLPEPIAADAARAAARYPGVTLADLADGRALYRARCAACHRPVAPAAIAPAAWPGEIAKMQRRAGITSDEARAIERYVVAIATRSGS